MKRLPYSLVISFLLLSSLTAISQDSGGHKHKAVTFAGVFAGINHSTVHGTMVDEQKESIAGYPDGYSDKQEDGTGYYIYAALQHNLSSWLHLKYGLGFNHRQVNPEDHGNSVYKDTLRTSYVAVPVFAGIHTPLAGTHWDLLFEAGPTVQFKVAGRSVVHSDRTGFKVLPSTLTGCLNAGIGYQPTAAFRVSVNYQYMHDFTDAYHVNLAWNDIEPNKEFNYRYNTHVVAIGLQWRL